MKILAYSLSLLMFFYYSTNISYAQGKKTTESTVLTGFVGVNFTETAQYLTFGGPSLKLKSGGFKVVVGLQPAIYFENGQAAPTLGGVFQIAYKNIGLTLPALYLKNERWETAIGIGLYFPLKNN